jgi:hypothetical protein
MVTDNWEVLVGFHLLTSSPLHTKGGKVYQAQKDSMKPSHEKKKTRPCGSMGFRIGTLRAFLLTGLTVGVRQRSDTLKPIIAEAVARGSRSKDSGDEMLVLMI